MTSNEQSPTDEPSEKLDAANEAGEPSESGEAPKRVVSREEYHQQLRQQLVDAAAREALLREAAQQAEQPEQPPEAR